MIGSLPPVSQTSNGMERALERLGSGRRINSAKDDAAGLAVEAGMSAQMGGLAQAQRNVGDALSLTETAEGALGGVSEVLQRMRELALQAANGSLGATDRIAIQSEFSQLAQSVDAAGRQAEFNGKRLLDGSFSESFQTGPNAGDSTGLSIGDATAAGLGVEGIDVLTPAGASAALGAIDGALSSVSGMRSSLGAAQSGFLSAAGAASGTYASLASARSRIADADYGAETGNLAREGVLREAGLRATKIYNAIQAMILDSVPRPPVR